MGWLNGRSKEDEARGPVSPEPPTQPEPVETQEANANTRPPQRTTNPFSKAVKYDARGRVALIGPAGGGKSYTALLLARCLAGPAGKIAAIDTEHGSLSKYADLFDFDVMELESFSPQSFIAALHAAEDAGYAVFLCDSLSHFWTGKDGAFDFVDMAQKRHKDQQGGWKDFRPHERGMVDDMIASPCHVICTLRTKNAYQEQTDDKGKVKRVKVGLAPVQRDGLEYEFDLVGYLDEDNTFAVDKTRCPAYAQKAYTKPGPKEFAPFVDWLKGAAREPRMQPPPPRTIDTGGHPNGTQAAANHVAEQKLASGNVTAAAPLKAPWTTLVQAGTMFAAVRERVGEVVWREALAAAGWNELVEITRAMGSTNTDTKTEARRKARELYWFLDALAQREGK